MLDASVLDQFDGLCYVTDRQGKLESIGSTNWDAFAISNLAPSTVASKVVGKNLFDFITGEPVKDQLRDVMQRLSDGSFDAWVMPYRCDSPQIKRNMRLSIRPVREQHKILGFLFQSVLLSSEERPPIELFNFAAQADYSQRPHSLPTISMCSYCQRVKDEKYIGDQWIDAEEYYMLGGTSEVRISHGICEQCIEKAIGGAFEKEVGG